MAYLDNKSIIVDAVLTKRGREIIAKNGNLNITSFALADDEIDYSLYNQNAASSELMDLGIVNTPVFEPNVNETEVMKYKLVTLDEGSTFIPVVSIVQSSIEVASTYTGTILISPSTSPANYNSNLGYTAILSNNKIGSLIVSTQAPNLNNSTATVATFAGDITSDTSQTVVGMVFSFIPNNKLKSTTTATLTIIGNESGGGVSIPVTVTV